MRAAIWTGANEPLVIEELQSPVLGPNDVRIEIAASGLCHSDLSIIRGLTVVPPPAILGHEATGTVVEVGSAVSRVKVGDHVIGSLMPTCGNCWMCRHDHSNLCEEATFFGPGGIRADGSVVGGLTGLGAFADEMVFDETRAIKIDSDLPVEQLALIGCAISTGVGAALNTARVEPGSAVAVFGCGGVGQSVIQGARIAGASRIFAVDPVELKRKTAERLGATDLIDPTDGDPVEQIQAATGGRGADYAFEALGNTDVMLQAYNAVRPAGTVVVVGLAPMDAVFSIPAGMFLTERKLLGSMYGSSEVRRDFQRYIALVENGRLDIGAMVTRTIGLDDINEGFRSMEAGEVIRSVII